jgi:hypothetical protein
MFVCLSDSSSKDKQLCQTISMKDEKYEGGGRMKVKIHILFYGDNA